MLLLLALVSLVGMPYTVLMPILGRPPDLGLGRRALPHCRRIFALRLPSLRRAVRPIYLRRGILREVSRGIESASDLQQPPEQ